MPPESQRKNPSGCSSPYSPQESSITSASTQADVKTAITTFGYQNFKVTDKTKLDLVLLAKADFFKGCAEF